jgi:hypothetical protein
MFKMENTEGFPTPVVKVKTYAEEDIQVAVENYVLSWDYDSLIRYVVEGMYKKYMDRKQPRVHIDNLMEKFGESNEV